MAISHKINSVLEIFGARLIRHSSHQRLHQRADFLEEANTRLAHLRERDDLEITQLRAESARLHTTLQSLQRRINSAIVVPKDYPIQPRPHSYIYQQVNAVLDRYFPVMRDFLGGLLPYMYGSQLKEVPDEKTTEAGPYWNNGYFNADDARTAYAITAHLKPAVILECGCGNSTKFFRKAISDYQLNTRLVSIDPQPRASISGVSDHIINRDVLDVDLTLFRELGLGDVLFIDGSHLAFNGTDVVHFFLNILPIIRPGVLVHIHDIFLPYEYDELFTERCYNEQYLLGTLLIYSDRWLPLVPVMYLKRRGAIRYGGGSFWMKRLEDHS